MHSRNFYKTGCKVHCAQFWSYNEVSYIKVYMESISSRMKLAKMFSHPQWGDPPYAWPNSLYIYFLTLLFLVLSVYLLFAYLFDFVSLFVNFISLMLSWFCLFIFVHIVWIYYCAKFLVWKVSELFPIMWFVCLFVNLWKLFVFVYIV